MEKSSHREEIYKKMEDLERQGIFDRDLEDDPPTIPLKPGEVDFERKKLSSKIKSMYADKVSFSFFNKLIRKGDIVIDSYEGIECNETVGFYGKILAYLEGYNFNVIEKDAFSLDFSKKYDRIFSYPPRDFINDDQVLCYTKDKLCSDTGRECYESAFILKALDLLEDNGRAVIFTFQNVLTAPNFAGIRKHLIEENCLEAVIALPSGLLTFTNISTAILILKKGCQKAKIVDASSVHSVSRRGGRCYTYEDIEAIIKLVKEEGDNNKLVTFDQIRKNNYDLSPASFLFEAKIIVDFDCEYKPLSELVSKKISRGVQYKAEDLKKHFTSEASDFYYVSAKDIQEGQIVQNLQKLNEISEKNLSSVLQEDDIVLVMALTGSLKIAHVHDLKEKKIIPASNLYVIRLDKKLIHPLFLKMLLETTRANDLFNYFGVGSTILSISAEFMNKLLIPLPPLEKQLVYVEKYSALEREGLELKERIKKIEEEKKDLI